MVPKATTDVEELAVPVKTIARSVVLSVVSAVIVPFNVAVAPLAAVTETAANSSAVPVPPMIPKVTLAVLAATVKLVSESASTMVPMVTVAVVVEDEALNVVSLSVPVTLPVLNT